MARPLRIEFPGAVYHVTARGDGREAIYLSDEDRQTFLDVFTEVMDRFQWQCHAYCLMGNHYHLLVETPQANLSRGMRQLNGVYTQRFNRRYGRVGHVFQGRYKAILIEKDSHLLELCRYVVLNPVRAQMVSDVAQWPWSSYRATVGLSAKPNSLTTDWVLAQFGGSRRVAGERYRRFVANGYDAPSPWSQLQGQDVLGSEVFRNKVRGQAGRMSLEVPRRQRHVGRPRLAALRASYTSRGAWMACAYREYGYTMREIAVEAGLHYSSVSKIIRAWEGQRDSTIKT